VTFFPVRVTNTIGDGQEPFFGTIYSNSTGTLQKPIKLALLSLQIRVTTDVFLRDENVGHAALTGDFFEGILESGAIFYNNSDRRSR
jgi:hypothetical protein